MHQCAGGAGRTPSDVAPGAATRIGPPLCALAGQRPGHLPSRRSNSWAAGRARAWPAYGPAASPRGRVAPIRRSGA
jgi:hypothetical protein